MQSFKQITHDLIPPVLGKIYHKSIRKSGFSGDYKCWKEASNASSGYDSDEIMTKVKEALLKVKNGEAVYERDSVLFDKVQYSWPLLAGLLWIASQEDNRLNLIDFGGSLGSSYYQNKKFLAHLRVLKWNIIEQKKFVDCGKRYFEGEHLKFYYHLDDCLKEQHSNTILLSSVIQYIEKPYELLKEIIGKRLKYVLFDRTPFLHHGEDRITVQKVPAEIYRASYPAWFFNQKKFLGFFSSEYELIADFESNDWANIPSVFKGYVFKLKQ
jgi:putative methyltransferase (TIGR04325 family)